MQLRFLLASVLLATCGFFSWRIIKASRSGRIPVFIHFGAERYFSRRSAKASFWIVLSWYVALAGAALYVAVEMIAKR